MEGWGDFADSLKTLVEKAFPNLEPTAKEMLALNQYLSQLENQQIAFGVKQRRPSSLVEAVSFTLKCNLTCKGLQKWHQLQTKNLHWLVPFRINKEQ